MSLEADFRSILSNHASLTNLVPAARIYTAYYPQASGDPAIRISKITGATGVHMQGSDGLSSTLMQIDIRGLASLGAVPVLAIRDVLMAKLHTFRGTVGSTFFQVISLDADRGIDFEKPTTTEYLTATLDFDVRSSSV